ELFGLADRLTTSLRQRRLPDPPADLTERIVARVLRQRRRGRRRLLVGVALAASVLLAVGVWTWLRQPALEGPAVVQNAPSVQEQLDEAGQAVVALTRR